MRRVSSLRQRVTLVEEQLPLSSEERESLWKRRADDERLAREHAQTERRIAEDALQVRPRATDRRVATQYQPPYARLQRHTTRCDAVQRGSAALGATVTAMGPSERRGLRRIVPACRVAMPSGCVPSSRRRYTAQHLVRF